MDAGFETIGNATLICHDRRPILVTDPWIVGEAYFGSWTRSHHIPDEQMQAIAKCQYVWLSHGHPDHLSMTSLALLKDKIILVPDHVGGRIARDLRALGYQVSILKDREWTSLSPRIRIVNITDVFQDAVLLVDIGGTLLINVNDAADHGWGSFVRKTARLYKESFLLKLFGHGDADMINFIDAEGKRLNPLENRKRIPVGQSIANVAESMGVTHVVPFSSMHKYQRSDSAWVNQYTTQLGDYRLGFASKRCTLLPAFIRYDCLTKEVQQIQPPEASETLLDPTVFGDYWNDRLEKDDVLKLESYFKSIQHVGRCLDFINFRVGGQDYRLEFKSRGLKKGLVFEAPRNSLMQAIEHECFDDLLIGNFMRTRLEGPWSKMGLYPDFTPYVAKYSDNGGAKTDDEVRRYLREYWRRSPVGYTHASFERVLRTLFLSYIGANTPLYAFARRMWWSFHKYPTVFRSMVDQRLAGSQRTHDRMSSTSDRSEEREPAGINQSESSSSRGRYVP